jgi:undecaprenyl-diphosphatase
MMGAETPAIESTKRRRLQRRLAALRLWRAEMIYILALAAFAALALLARHAAYFDWDLAAARTLQNLPVPGLFGFMRAVSIIGDGWNPYALAALTVALLLALRRRSEAMGLLFSAGGSALVNALIKTLIARPRPGADLVAVFRPLKSQSFPSGHVTFYVCYFGFLFFVAFALLPRGSLLRRLALGAAALPVTLVGLSRVYLGEHWPSDALGAYLLGGVWLALSLDLYRRWKERAAFRRQPGNQQS